MKKETKKKQRKFKHTKQQYSSAPVKEVTPPQAALEKKHFKLPSFVFSFKKEQKKESKNKTPNRFKIAVVNWLRRHDSDVQLILFPLILVLILIILSIFNSQLFVTLSRQKPVADDQITILNPYPYVQAVGAPEVSAQAAIILDRGSQVILFSKNPLLRFSMASTTKIITALVALDYYKSDDVLTVKTGSVAGSGLNLTPGEQFHFMDLMYAMLLPSANDAAQAIADNYPGGS